MSRSYAIHIRQGGHCSKCSTAVICKRSRSGLCMTCSRRGVSKTLTQEERQRRREASTGANNPNWKGDQVSYGSLHNYIRYNLPKPPLCQLCAIKPAFDLANISQRYLRDLTDWEWLCRRCHMKKDGRLQTFISPATQASARLSRLTNGKPRKSTPRKLEYMCHYNEKAQAA